MKTRSTNITIKSKSIVRIVLITALVLLLPLLAMQFTDEVNWDVTDFVISGSLLIGFGLIFELLMTKINAKYRAVIAVVLVAALLLIWLELAVGIFGTPISGS